MVAAMRENYSDAYALPSWFDGLIVEIEAEAQLSNLLRREDGIHCAFLVAVLVLIYTTAPEGLSSEGYARWICTFALYLIVQCTP